MRRSPEIYTQETVVFLKGVAKADIRRPIYVYTDEAGNHAVSDGNHRSVRALIEGEINELPRNVIGHINRNVSKDPNYKPISRLKIVEG